MFLQTLRSSVRLLWNVSEMTYLIWKYGSGFPPSRESKYTVLFLKRFLRVRKRISSTGWLATPSLAIILFRALKSLAKRALQVQNVFKGFCVRRFGDCADARIEALFFLYKIAFFSKLFL